MSTVQTQERLIEACESVFVCEQGPPKAYFEIPQRVGKPVRVTYVTYSAVGDNLDELELWFIENVIAPLADTGAFLYWRLPSSIVVYSTQVHQKQKDYVIRTRLAVLDKELNPVVLKAVVPEGEAMPRVGK